MYLKWDETGIQRYTGSPPKDVIESWGLQVPVQPEQFQMWKIILLARKKTGRHDYLFSNFVSIICVAMRHGFSYECVINQARRQCSCSNRKTVERSKQDHKYLTIERRNERIDCIFWKIIPLADENFLVEDGAIWTKERSFDGFFIRNVATHVENLAASLNIGVVSYIGHQLIISWSLTFLNIPCHGVLN